LFVSLRTVFVSVLSEIKVDELRKRQEIQVTRNIIVNKTKRQKGKEQKQETGNKEHIVDEALLFKLG